MKVLAVDDERLALDNLCEAIGKAIEDAELYSYRKVSEARDCIARNRIDIAFLDIQMRETSGIEFAEEIKINNPDVNIVFCTGYDQYMKDAFGIHASGYLIKPITSEMIVNELNNLRHPVSVADKLVQIRAGQVFEIYDMEGNVLPFKRNKSKKILEILYDVNGKPIQPWEISAIMWEKDVHSWNITNQSYFRTLMSDINRTLKNIDAERLVVKTEDGYAMNVSLVKVK